MKFIFDLFNTSQIAGWVRAGIAAALGALSLNIPFVGELMKVEGFETAVGVVVGTIVVGLWSSLAKKYQ